MIKLMDLLKENNEPAFSIHDKKVGDIVEMGGKKVKITKLESWVKDKTANCMQFKGFYTGDKDRHEVTFVYDDGIDGYKFKD